MDDGTSDGARNAALEETHVYVEGHGFYNYGTTTIFYVHIVNLEAGSCLLRTPEKALAKEDKEKKEKYLHPCMDYRCHFNSLVFSDYGIPRAEAWASTQQMDLYLRFKLKREYLEMYSLV